MTSLATVEARPTGVGLDRVGVDGLKALADARAGSTRRTYAAHVARWDQWCAPRGIWPNTGEESPTTALRTADAADAVAWITSRAAEGLAPTSLRVCVSALSSAHKATTEARQLAGHAARPNPWTGALVSRVLSGLSRQAAREGRAHPRGQARAMTSQVFADIQATLRLDRSSKGRRDAALISIMRWGLMRRSEAAALRWGDLTVSPDGDGLVTISRSKTDQTGEGAVQYLPAQAVRLVDEWRQAAEKRGWDTGPDAPMWGPKGIAGATVSRVIRRRGERAGHPGLSGHSPRVGMAQDLVGAGHSLVELQVAGRWSSPAMPAHYARNQTASQGAVARFADQTGANG